MVKHKMTERQKRFADNYLELGNVAQSAIKAGYSEAFARKGAEKLLANTGIRAYLSKRMQELKTDDKSKIASQKEVIEFLSRMVRGEELTKRKVYDKDMGWIEITETPSEKGKLTAASELLKRYPDNPELVEAQVAKAKADAENARAQAELAKEKAAGANLRNNHSESEMSKLSDEDLRAIAELERKEAVEDGD